MMELMDNTVGSLTEEQKSILIGCLLGDGTMRKKKNALLEINHLKSRFGFESRLNRDKIYFRIRVQTQSAKRFVNLIEPHILKDFRYKLPL